MFQVSHITIFWLKNKYLFHFYIKVCQKHVLYKNLAICEIYILVICAVINTNYFTLD